MQTGGPSSGILRDFIEQDVHHPNIDELICVDDMRTRKAGLDERADAFIALPGGLGTLEELAEILSFRKLALHRRILVLIDDDGFYAPLLEQIERGIAEGLDKPEVREYFAVTREPVRAIELCEASAS